jgi:hypothetical protein
MNCKYSLGLILAASVALSAIANHAVVHWMGIFIQPVEYRQIGKAAYGKSPAFAAGSSLMGDGLAWPRICREIGEGVETWFVPGSSPAEWVSLQSFAPNAKLTFLVVSIYDLNEDSICDVRADLVPLHRAIQALWQSQSTWRFSRRVLSQYPLKYIRVLYPSAGRSEGVMIGLREKIRTLISPWLTITAEVGPKAPSGGEAAQGDIIQTDKISEWSSAKALRRVASMRSANQGRHSFQGPKEQAFIRMLHQGSKQGRVVVVVLPVSPIYAREFLPPYVMGAFEAMLVRAGRQTPDAKWVRLDQVSELNNNGNFWDLVHMNTFGQKIATETLLNQLQGFDNTP